MLVNSENDIKLFGSIWIYYDSTNAAVASVLFVELIFTSMSVCY